MEMILRGPPSFGQGETKSKLARKHMLSRRHCMPSRHSMHLCLCKLVLRLNHNGKLIMNRLLFMTYNGWVMLAMFIGSFLGYLFFGGGTPATKETACH
jgi:hypothetical protein